MPSKGMEADDLGLRAQQAWGDEAAKRRKPKRQKSILGTGADVIPIRRTPRRPDGTISLLALEVAREFEELKHYADDHPGRGAGEVGKTILYLDEKEGAVKWR